MDVLFVIFILAVIVLFCLLWRHYDKKRSEYYNGETNIKEIEKQVRSCLTREKYVELMFFDLDEAVKDSIRNDYRMGFWKDLSNLN